jgi:hypothetical protein
MHDGRSEYFRARYEAGDKLSLLQAILYAGMFREPIPDWAAEALKSAYEEVKRGGASSWDEVFGKPHPKGKHLRTIQQEAQKYLVHETVCFLHEKEGAAIDGELFGRVGQLTGVGSKTLIGRLYYEVKEAFERVGPIGPNPRGQ